ncbi:MAG: stage 0 sporulation family protein [Coriobacteriia bacterium]|nr:stage 0 sporulation family protein [Coriobacteriia bacterium]
MPTVVGVRLRSAPKVLWFDPAGSEPAVGQCVVVRTERGQEIGEVASAPAEVEESELPAELKPVERIATDEDLARAEELREREAEAMPVFRELVGKHGLDMKPVGVQTLFDSSKMVFYFAAEERVDFRELVKELASRFKTRIDMRQIGVRDEARMVGGLGHCGEQLCCARLGGEFHPVSIRMAKEQDLPLNPLKISGVCGRLMCCLRYEYDAYKEYKSRAPKRGAEVETPLGAGKVVELNTPKETVTIRLFEGGSLTVPLGSMECGKDTGCPCKVPPEAIQRPGLGVLEAAQAPAPTGEAKAEAGGGAEKPPSRRRRRRGGGGKREGGGEASAAKGEPGQRPKAETKPKPEAKAADGGGEAAKPARPGRRRRRRRPSGGAQSGSTGGE